MEKKGEEESFTLEGTFFHITLNSSLAGISTTPGMGMYSMSKFALRSLAEAQVGNCSSIFNNSEI